MSFYCRTWSILFVSKIHHCISSFCVNCFYSFLAINRMGLPSFWATSSKMIRLLATLATITSMITMIVVARAKTKNKGDASFINCFYSFLAINRMGLPSFWAIRSKMIRLLATLATMTSMITMIVVARAKTKNKGYAYVINRVHLSSPESYISLYCLRNVCSQIDID